MDLEEKSLIKSIKYLLYKLTNYRSNTSSENIEFFMDLQDVVMLLFALSLVAEVMTNKVITNILFHCNLVTVYDSWFF